MRGKTPLLVLVVGILTALPFRYPPHQEDDTANAHQLITYPSTVTLNVTESSEASPAKGWTVLPAQNEAGSPRPLTPVVIANEETRPAPIAMETPLDRDDKKPEMASIYMPFLEPYPRLRADHDAGVSDRAARVATAPPAPSEVQPEPRRRRAVQTHTIVDGDSLSSIAARYLGTPERYLEIYDANRERLPAPDLLPLGVRLLIPVDGQ